MNEVKKKKEDLCIGVEFCFGVVFLPIVCLECREGEGTKTTMKSSQEENGLSSYLETMKRCWRR